MFQEWFEDLLNFITRKEQKEDYWVYLKAKSKLAKELDIKRFITNLHLIHNAVKFLTTARQRSLMRMKADKNVIVLKEDEKELLE